MADTLKQQLEINMNNNRIAGSAQQAKGAIQEAAGKMTGDSKLKAQGAANKTAGKVRNAIGGVEDAIKGE